MQVKVSVILPFYNAANSLSNAIESVLEQSFSDFELILIDNNSTDNSYHIAAEYIEMDERVILIEEPRQGIVYALNAGIKEASADYIALMDANDTSLPERIEKQYSYLTNHSDIGVVSCQINFSSTITSPEYLDGLKMFVQWNNNLITHEEISNNRFVEVPMLHSTVMFRQELVSKFGAYSNGDFPEDYELWLRWLSNGVKMHKLPEVLLNWLDLPERFTRKAERFTDQAFYEVKSKYMADWLAENNKFHPEVVVWGAGRQSRQRFALLHELGADAKFHIDLRANPDRKVIEVKHTPPAGRHFIISYVSNRSAREKIKIFLVELGYTEGKDFICMA